MPMTHIPEIGAENRYQQSGTINRQENRALSFSLPEIGIGKIRYQTPCQTLREPVPVFWYRRRSLVCVSLALDLEA